VRHGNKRRHVTRCVALDWNYGDSPALSP
jgi:hypothetical protein